MEEKLHKQPVKPPPRPLPRHFRVVLFVLRGLCRHFQPGEIAGSVTGRLRSGGGFDCGAGTATATDFKYSHFKQLILIKANIEDRQILPLQNLPALNHYSFIAGFVQSGSGKYLSEDWSRERSRPTVSPTRSGAIFPYSHHPLMLSSTTEEALSLWQ